jgi:glycosyltransferase involved in cell wall biosynthesis
MNAAPALRIPPVLQPAEALAHETPRGATPARKFRILHATRAPIGGIFRHILDLANGQIERGHDVGIITDSLTGGQRAEAALAEIAPRLSLGVHRLPIRREPHFADLTVIHRFLGLTRRLRPDVLHGHGAKAGAFVRLRGYSPTMLRIYTPHGGSLHYSRHTLKGKVYGAIEAALAGRTDLCLFESRFARDAYERMIGPPSAQVRCVFNGVTTAEFEPVLPATDAADLVYVGEFRFIKGADLLIEAVAKLRASGRPLTLALGGDGEELTALRALVERLNLQSCVRFLGHVKARDGFSKGRLLVVPSRGDSMPYVVIEAAAANVPMIAANVGGIPEIFGAHSGGLFAASDVDAMARAIAQTLDNPHGARARADAVRARVFQHFSQDAMVEGVLAGYRDAFAMR